MLTLNPTPISIPFDYNLSVSPTKGNVMQGNDIHANVTINYLQGLPENITLNAIGIPLYANYSFSKLEKSPTSNDTLNSILTIHISKDVAHDPYNITITSTSDNGKTYSALYNLSVISAEVSVSGTVTTNKERTPTQITFQLLWKPDAATQTFTAPIQSSSYAISLPNNEFFAVKVDWKSPEGSTGTNYFVQPFSTTFGKTTIICPFSWEDYS